MVLVLGRAGDLLARDVAERLRGRFRTQSETIESSAELREVVSRLRDRIGVLVVGAGDPTSASTLVWELDRAMDGISARTVVVVEDPATLDAVPARLLDALTYVTADRVLAGESSELGDVVERVMFATRPIDVLASLVRTATARRNLDSVPPLVGDWTSVERLEIESLALAHDDDDGRRANPLWAAWVQQREGAAIERLGNRLASLSMRGVRKG